MCGIVGLLHPRKKIDETLFSQMMRAIHHRGPDAKQHWQEENITLGHLRLSIHDLSQAGAQPMLSFSERWMIVFNGEIYNYQQIKKELLSDVQIGFKGNSDTEVLINAIDCWGIEKTLKKCKGMFAFSAWDRKEKKLYLARDRFGEKPLYYGMQKDIFAFASELKALKPLNAMGWQFNVDRHALTNFMRYAYIASPHCIYENMQKLSPGCYLVVDENLKVVQKPYWESKDVLSSPKFTGSFEEAVDALENKLKNTLQLQMLSDVPLGAFLSGGVDSSAIVALMQSLSSERIKTFSIGFDVEGYNEAPFAKAVANHLKTDHTELYLTERDALNIVPSLPTMYDEPFGDSSQIPTFLVSQLARKQVTVSLSGDAGDELFCGYNRYFFAEKKEWKLLNNSCVRWGIKHAPLNALRMTAKFSKKHTLLFDKLLKLQRIVQESKNFKTDFYKNACSQIHRPGELVLNGGEYDIYAEKGLLDLNLSFIEWMMFADSNTYMIDDILTKVDRAAMAVSLETRVPFLDHEIYEFAWSLPLSYKLNAGISKRVLREVLYRYVPKTLIERPKMGFGIPVGKWLRGDLKEWADTLLDPKKITEKGYLNSDTVQKYWKEHLSGERDWQYALWNILMFQAWVENE